ncbi:hypothetical protein BCR35DRAFT_303309 [Leucosporidium creatinivorum]|uniref:F-box domain-containing protein n=1 Tax=Leucosporidium creatinivorum TaxID=106004 RepID=A0A1Y2FHR7_9BASI|nr:hypothetical protein BCR35DRAFT_303309 [Leucosporidium creatinivorum]
MSAPPSSSPNNLNNLPTEILSIILDFIFSPDDPESFRPISQRQLAHLCRVSHAFLPIARDHLYHTIHLDLDLRSHPPSSRFAGDEDDQAPANDLHPTLPIIRTLVDHPHLGNYARQVDFSKHLYYLNTDSSEELPEIAQLLELCPHLEAVQMSFNVRLGLELGGIVAPLNASSRKLKILSVGAVSRAERVRGEKGLRRSLATFFDSQTEVEELIMSGVDGHLAISTDPPAWRLRKLETTPSSFPHLAHHSKSTLRHLHLHRSHLNLTKAQRLDLTAFAALQSLSLEDYYSGDRKKVDELYRRSFPLCPPSLTTLRIIHGLAGPSIAIDQLFPLLPPTLVHLNLRNTTTNISRFAAMLSQRILPSLKTLRYTRFEMSNGQARPEDEEDERRLFEVGFKQGVRVIPTSMLEDVDLFP